MVAQQIVSHYQIIKNRIKSYIKACQWDFFVKLEYQSSTTILSVGKKYYVRDLFCDVINNAWPAN